MLRSRIGVIPAIAFVYALLTTSCAFETEPAPAQYKITQDKAESRNESLVIVDDQDDPPLNRCLTDAQANMSASAWTIDLGQSSTLQWNVTVPSGCSPIRVYLNTTQVGANSSMVVTPLASTTFNLRLYITGYGERVLSSVTVSVNLTQQIAITSNNQVPTFVQALGTANTTITVANNVQLDLTNRHDIDIASNVVLRGGRNGLEPGPRIFTTTRYPVLFSIGRWSTNVRITGVRIEGPDIGSNERHENRGILVDSATKVEIDHNEISGFTLAAINVWDTNNTSESPNPNATPSTHTVNIHDNYIHHNQAVGGDGYGIAVGYGAHPMIARNVFDWNRHAIEGDGKEGTGYTAIHNLVLENGGLHRWIPFPGTWVHTHQFDMHALNDCGIADAWSDSLANCGPAGHTMIIRNNAFFYAEDNAIKLRGTPAVGMFVGQNIFANHASFDAAVHQNESGLVHEADNVLGFNGKQTLATCDFNGDGLNDSFMATGQNWWMRSGGTAMWEFLNASTRRLSEISIGYFDSDNRCDVVADDVLFPGGRPPNPFRPGGGGVYEQVDPAGPVFDPSRFESRRPSRFESE